MPSDPRALLRSRNYVRLLVLAAILGVPISAVAYGFLALVSYLQKEIFIHLPHGLGFRHRAGVVAAAGAGGGRCAGRLRHPVSAGQGRRPQRRAAFAVHAPPTAVQLPGVILAALATLVFGAVLGPEMPLIALGGGLAALVIRLARRRDGARPGGQGAGCHRELRGRQHAAGIAPDRRVLADGGVRAGRADTRSGAAAGPAGGRDRLAHLHRPGQPDRAGHVLAGPARPAGLQPAHRGRVRLGDRDRPGRRPDRPRHPAAGAVPAALRRQVAHDRGPAGRRGGRRAGDHLRRGDRQGHLRRALLGTERARPAHHPRRQLLGGRAAAADGVQGARLRRCR